MKRFFAVLLLVPAVLAAQQKNNGFSITGNIRGLAEKSRVFITDANNPSDTLAKAHVKGGVFVLTGHISEPNLVEVNFVAAAKKTMLFIGNDEVKMDGTIEDTRNIVYKGSPTQDEFLSFQKTFNAYFVRLNSLAQQANSPAGAGKSDSLSHLYASTVAQVQSALDEFLKTRENSPVSAFVLVAMIQLSEDVFLLERRFNALSPAVQQGFYGKYLKEQIDNGKIGAIGTDEIDFTQNDTTGTPVSLSSFKGKYVLVDFWASWCRPCRMENPNVVATYGKFRNKNFTVLSVSLDRDRDSWIKAIKDDNLTWFHVSDLKYWNNDVAVKYRIQSIPQNLLIDPSGKIVAKNLRGAELDAKLCELLGCN